MKGIWLCSLLSCLSLKNREPVFEDHIAFLLYLFAKVFLTHMHEFPDTHTHTHTHKHTHTHTRALKNRAFKHWKRHAEMLVG